MPVKKQKKHLTIQWVKESKASINENPDVRKALDEISAGLSKSGAAIKDFVQSEQVQNVIEKAKDGAVTGTQKFADFVKDTLKKD